MRRRLRAGWLAAAAALWMSGPASPAGVVMDSVPVGEPGNVDDTEGTGYGAVDHAYSIGTFEVTARQYTTFLNAVAVTDTYGLYSPNMADTAGALGCNIQRTGTPGSLSYAVAADWADRPVNFVSWGDAVRFANWLHNGQPHGAQGPGTTEDGSYALGGATDESALMAVTRANSATWVIPAEDEWYKAAYYDDAAGVYYDFPMGTDLDWPNLPGNALLDPDPGNSANYSTPLHDGPTLGAPYWRTEVGAFSNSASPYGTFDQGGNVWEWNETIFDESSRGMRGGSFGYSHGMVMHAMAQNQVGPLSEFNVLGFRVALVPEPATLSFVAVGGVLLLRRKRQ